MALTVGVVVLMFTLMIPPALKMIEKAKFQNAVPELERIAHQIDLYQVQNRNYPDSLLDLFNDVPLDPWGNPYQYLKIADSTNTKNNLRNSKRNLSKGQRKKNGAQLNSDYDLYSMGPDGQSQAPLTAAASRDDIIRAKNGRFFGLAEDYN